jgi:hypothetical protein
LTIPLETADERRESQRALRGDDGRLLCPIPEGGHLDHEIAVTQAGELTEVQGATRQCGNWYAPFPLEYEHMADIYLTSQVGADAGSWHQVLVSERVGLLLLQRSGPGLDVHDDVAKFVREAQAEAICRCLLVEQEQRRFPDGLVADHVQLSGSQITDEDEAAGLLDDAHQVRDGPSALPPLPAHCACGIGSGLRAVDLEMEEPMGLLSGGGREQGTYLEAGQNQLGFDSFYRLGTKCGAPAVMDKAIPWPTPQVSPSIESRDFG